MLQLSGGLLNKPILSLRTGGQVATATAAIINPNNLKIEGWYCHDRFSKKILVLLAIDVRDVIPQGLVVNDHDALTDPDELVRLKDIMQINFTLIDKPVYTLSKEKVGKISDFAVDLSSLYIQKLYVTQSLLKSFSGGSLSIDRTQIVEITNRKIIIQDLLKGTRAPVPATLPVT